MTATDPDDHQLDPDGGGDGGGTLGGEFIEIVRSDTVWRFERDFLESNWTCLFGRGCKGILDHDATELNQGCCSLGAHFGDGPAGVAEAMNVAAYAAMLTPEQFQFHAVANSRPASEPDDGPDDNEAIGIFGNEERTHTRLVDGACIFLNRPGFAGGEGCALHIAAIEFDESPTEWKPSVCWQLPLRIDWQELDADTEQATVRRWTRADWGDHGRTMAWCCTERADGAEAYCGDEQVIDSMSDSLRALAGDEVYVELRRRL
ncbi:MAG TPA: hypothetical protein VLN74_13795 [Ilumatobacteraceae bacterium]|nr:hypothetical protein [Ilumatobacteraceae bacterium]